MERPSKSDWTHQAAEPYTPTMFPQLVSRPAPVLSRVWIARRRGAALRMMDRVLACPRVLFLREFLAHPRRVGAVCASSRRLASSIIWRNLPPARVDVYRG